MSDSPFLRRHSTRSKKPGSLSETLAVDGAPAAVGLAAAANSAGAANLPAAADVPAWRYRWSRRVVSLGVRLYSRLRVEGFANLPDGPAVLCFNHLDWADPLFLMAALPVKQRLYFFGPQQENMDRGGRNRLMLWAGIAVPFKPGKRGLVAATHRVDGILGAGNVLAIAGEGRIHAGETELLPLNGGSAYFASRCGVPVVPVAINGTSWLGFRDVVRIKVGTPIQPRAGRPSQQTMNDLTEEITRQLRALVSDFPDKRRPRLLGRWLTEVFNEWPEGVRPVPPSR